MKKVREKLLSKQVAIERSSKAKKMRELRKYGKKVSSLVTAFKMYYLCSRCTIYCRFKPKSYKSDTRRRKK